MYIHVYNIVLYEVLGLLPYSHISNKDQVMYIHIYNIVLYEVLGRLPYSHISNKDQVMYIHIYNVLLWTLSEKDQVIYGVSISFASVILS